jgi:predicted Zn-dependent protease
MQPIILRLKADSYINLVEKAVKMLNEAFLDMNPKVIFCISKEYDYKIKFVSRERMLSLIGKEALGFCDKTNRTIYILYDANLQNDESELLSTIMHEALHALGLQHLSETHSLMHEREVGVRGVTDYDVKALTQHLRQINQKGGER